MSANSWRTIGCRGLICTFLIVGLISTETIAAPITLNFQGTVTLVEGPLNGGPINIGDSITGSFGYESTTPGFIDVVLTRFDAVTDVSFTVGGYSASRSGPATRNINVVGFGGAAPHFLMVSLRMTMG